MSVSPMQAQEQILVNTCISFKHIIGLILALNMWQKLLPIVINSTSEKMEQGMLIDVFMLTTPYLNFKNTNCAYFL